jgi:hypothetical protein
MQESPRNTQPMEGFPLPKATLSLKSSGGGGQSITPGCPINFFELSYLLFM